MATFRLYDNNIIYLYYWITPKKPFKFSTAIKIDADKWDKSKKRPKSPNYKYNGKNITKELARIENAFHEANNFFDTHGGFSSIKLRIKINEILSGVSAKNSNGNSRFLEFYKEQFEMYKVKNINNWKSYRTTYNHLKSYFGRSVPDFEDIDMSFYIKYNQFLLDKNLSTNSISDHWKFIKAIMRKAQLLNLHSNTDYQLFKQTNEKANTISLSEDELQTIFELKLSGYQDKARNYFLLGCYTGLRFEDWDQVNKSKIIDGQLTVISPKTGEKSIIPVSNNLLRILNKYPDGTLPKKPSNQKMNKYIKEVAKLAELNDKKDTRITKGGKKVIDSKPKHQLVSTHTARRSFATIMVLNGVQPHLIMKITGHKTLSSFEKYIRFDELQASIQLKESEAFKRSFGEALSFSEKLKTDPEFKKEQTKLLLP